MKSGLFDLTGKVAIVTGGNGGIGLGIARGLAEAGADIVVVGRNEAKSSSAVTDLKACGVRAISITADVTEGSRRRDDRANRTRAWPARYSRQQRRYQHSQATGCARTR